MALKDNKIFRLIIIPICIALCFVGKFIPGFGGLTSEAIQVLFTFLGCLTLWLTIGIDWPSLLCIFALGFVDSLGFSTVLSKSFGNATFIFLLFTFICTYALSKTSILKRITLAFINSPLAKRNGFWFSTLFLLAVLVVGLFTSPSVLFVVIYPILTEIFNIAKIEKGSNTAKALLMGLGFTVSISSGMTPIAHVFPILALQAANIEVSTFKYMLFAMPIGFILFALMILMFTLILKPDYSKLKNVDTSSIKDTIPKLDKKDIIISFIFIIVILLWVLPDIISPLKTLIGGYGTAMPPMLGVLLLLVIRVDDKPLLKVDEAFKNVPWGSLLMCAATLILGVALTSDSIGIKTFLQNNLSSNLVNVDGFILLFIFILWAGLQTNVSSNMVTATLVATVASSVLSNISSTLEITPIICLIGFMASLAFATPPSMPHIAIIAGSEYCTTKDVLIYGGILTIVSVILFVFIAYPYGIVLF